MTASTPETPFEIASPAEASPVPAVPPATPGGAPAAAAPAAEPTPAATAERLRALFPALFAGPAKPVKLRIQADIQARAPGEFTKAMLSAFLRRHTGSTGYLIALTKAAQRLDLDGQPAGDVSAEHREAAVQELARRRSLHDQRRQAEAQRHAEEDAARRERASLARTWRHSTLTKDNFCALKGLTPEALDALLAQAEREAAEMPPPPPRGPRDDRRDDHRNDRRGARPDGRQDGRQDRARGPAAERRADAPRGPGPGPGRGPRDHRGPRQGGAPRQKPDAG